MKTGLIYEKESGRIVMNVVAPDEESVLLQKLGRDDLEAILDLDLSGQDFYIVGGEPKPRPEMNLSVSGDAFLTPDEVMRVEGIEIGTDLIHPGGRATIDDGFIEWSTSEPGNYYFKFSKFPFKEISINAIVG